jgi:hypothetical protein
MVWSKVGATIFADAVVVVLVLVFMLVVLVVIVMFGEDARGVVGGEFAFAFGFAFGLDIIYSIMLNENIAILLW